MTLQTARLAPRFTDFEVDALTLAHRLLGQRLVRIVDGERLAGMIVEVEAYLGTEDRAAHSYGGRRTDRNASMYLPGGHAYVYLIYGIHHCLNVVCGAPEEPTAVLVRAVQPTEGIAAMVARRPRARRETDLCSGPGKLAQAMAIDRSHDGVDLRSNESLFIERCRARAMPRAKIRRTARIGVDYAGPWAERPLRLLIAGHPHVSK